jgi:hypothetical protein
VPPRQLASLRARFCLLLHANDLLFRKPQSLHRPPFLQAGL